MTNLEYVAIRNRLIPSAEKYANEVAGPYTGDKQSREDWCNVWNKAFHTEMNQLAKTMGIA